MNEFRNTNVLRTSVACFTLLLSACGGSGGGSDSDLDPSVSFAELNADAETTIGMFVDANGDLLAGVEVTDPENFPSGNVTYSGFITGSVDNVDLTGALQIEADFDDETFVATADNFIDETDVSYSGSLTGDDGTINTEGDADVPQLVVTIDGSLAAEGETFDTSLALDGDFVSDGGAAAGLAEGSVGSDIFEDGLFAVAED